LSDTKEGAGVLVDISLKPVFVVPFQEYFLDTWELCVNNVKAGIHLLDLFHQSMEKVRVFPVGVDRVEVGKVSKDHDLL